MKSLIAVAKSILTEGAFKSNAEAAQWNESQAVHHKNAITALNQYMNHVNNIDSPIKNSLIRTAKLHLKDHQKLLETHTFNAKTYKQNGSK